MTRPNFETMTTAELRAYCGHLHKVGLSAHKNQCSVLQIMSEQMSKAPAFVKVKLHRDLDGLVKRVQDNVSQLELLGISSHNTNDNQNKRLKNV